jgi:hypothetical protein
VSPRDALADLVGTDVYWVRAAVPVDRLGWFQTPQSGSESGAAAIVQYRGHQRSGRVIRLLSDLEAQGRMARILVAVQDPMSLKNQTAVDPPLLIGEYVRVNIQGRLLKQVYQIPRSSLQDNNTVWLADQNETLQIKAVDIVWRDEGIVLIKDQLRPGDRLIVTDLVTPVQGMPLEVVAKDSGSSGKQGNNG